MPSTVHAPADSKRYEYETELGGGAGSSRYECSRDDVTCVNGEPCST